MPGQPRAPTMRALVQRNNGRICDVSGCNRPRHGAARHCANHKNTVYRYGDPRARKIEKKEYAAERKEVRTLFDAHPDHSGVRNSIAWLQDLIDRAGQGDSRVPAYVHVARLYRYEVSGRDALIELCALWLFLHRRPHALPDDGEAKTFALAVAFLYLAPRDHLKSYHYQCVGGLRERRHYREARHAPRKAIGELLRKQLALLFVNVVRATEQQQQAERDARASLSVPFTTTKE